MRPVYFLYNDAKQKEGKQKQETIYNSIYDLIHIY